MADVITAADVRRILAMPQLEAANLRTQLHMTHHDCVMQPPTGAIEKWRAELYVAAIASGWDNFNALGVTDLRCSEASAILALASSSYLEVECLRDGDLSALATANDLERRLNNALVN